MISVDNLTVTFGGTDLFRDITFLVNDRDRIGLVGKNGAGKSTLMKIISGLQQPSSGTIAKNGDCTVGYLPQTMKIADSTTVFDETATAFIEVIALEKEIERLTKELGERTDYESDSYLKLIHDMTLATDHYHLLGGDTREADIEKTLLGLGFRRSDFTRSTSEFSGGWRMRIELAKLLLRRPSLFLLDEPTNHLDIESIQWLETYLKEYNGAVMVISHDRAFLDNITTRTIEILMGRAHDYKVSYSQYVKLRAERRAQQVAAYTNQQKMIEQTEDFIERFRYKATKSNQVQSRIKQLEKIERVELEDEDLTHLNIKFPPAPRSGQIVFEAKEVGKAFGEKRIFTGATLTLMKGEKVALVGRNGEGKTTFSRILIGELAPTEGVARLGHNVHLGYFAQNQDDLMDGDFTVYDTLDRVATGDIRTRLRDILGAFLFRGEEIDKKVRVLSGGERSRLAMARLMLEPYNLLVLDEPTNHMDMRSKDILKSALQAYDGTVVVVSHDREFLDGLVGKVYEFSEGAVKEHLGGIYDFLQAKKLQTMREFEASKKNAKAEKIEKAEKKNEKSITNEPEKPIVAKLSYEEKRQQDRKVRKLQSDIERIEQQIENLESELALMDEQLADPVKFGLDISDGKLFEQYSIHKREVTRLMVEWERASENLENQR